MEKTSLALARKLALASDILVEADKVSQKSQILLPGMFGPVPAEVVFKLRLTQAAWDRALFRSGAAGQTPSRLGGKSGHGFVFNIGRSRVLKLTDDAVEASSASVLKSKPMKEAYTVYDVFEFIDVPEVFGIVTELLHPPASDYVAMINEWAERKIQFFLPLVPSEVQDFFNYEYQYAPEGPKEALGAWLLAAAKGLEDRNILYTDFHKGNIMRRGDGMHVIIDIGGMSYSPRRRVAKASLQ